MRCPCGSGSPYDECCARYHGGERAPTAVALMRSRYCAFAVGDTDYLLRTWHPDTRPEALELEPGQRWLHLEVLSWTGGGVLDAEGEVEFRAHYRWSGGREELHERSAFRRVDGAWAYVEALG
ncbi:YchJ family protein [Actinosynnema sp.]|uniref:YchJ family protein n=1 Tax=Actinosynnema sp. TaxID=1872144 RepID=UPI003F82E64D